MNTSNVCESCEYWKLTTLRVRFITRHCILHYKMYSCLHRLSFRYHNNDPSLLGKNASRRRRLLWEFLRIRGVLRHRCWVERAGNLIHRRWSANPLYSHLLSASFGPRGPGGCVSLQQSCDPAGNRKWSRLWHTTGLGALDTGVLITCQPVIGT